MRRQAIAMAIIGLGLLASGLLLGTHQVYDASGFDCGSAFNRSDELQEAELRESLESEGIKASGCSMARGEAQELPLVLLVTGGSVLLAALTLSRRRGLSQEGIQG